MISLTRPVRLHVGFRVSCWRVKTTQTLTGAGEVVIALQDIVVCFTDACNVIGLFGEPLELAVGHDDFMASRKVREDV